MGTAASLPAKIDKAAAREYGGAYFDEAAFDLLQVDGVVSHEACRSAFATRWSSATALLICAVPSCVAGNLRPTFTRPATR